MKRNNRSHGGKGDKRRQPEVEESVIVEAWNRIFESGGKCPECTKYQCVCVGDDIKDEQQ